MSSSSAKDQSIKITTIYSWRMFIYGSLAMLALVGLANTIYFSSIEQKEEVIQLKSACVEENKTMPVLDNALPTALIKLEEKREVAYSPYIDRAYVKALDTIYDSYLNKHAVSTVCVVVPKADRKVDVQVAKILERKLTADGFNVKKQGDGFFTDPSCLDVKIDFK